MLKFDNKRYNEEYDYNEYDVILDKDYTVDEFIKTLITRNQGKGYISITSNDGHIKLERCEYHGNKIIKNDISKSKLNLMVDTAMAVKVNGMTNIFITVLNE